MDNVTVKNIRKGNKEAFKQVFDTYFTALCSFGNRYISDRSVVEDMVQDVFISFWEKRQDFDHINAVKAFLYTSVRNKCLNQLKHQLVIQKNEKELIHELESEQFFANHIIEEEVFNQLTTEIRNLPKSSQEIMILVLNGLTNPEIANELNISVNTVKTQKKIAYSKLKNSIGPIMGAILLSL